MTGPPVAITIDRVACRGAGACVRRAPRTFALDAEGKSRLVEPPNDDEDTIRAAAGACPYFAIELSAAPAEGRASDTSSGIAAG